MDTPYHIEILKRALGERVSAKALAAMTQANLRQDRPMGWLHPEFHFDDSLFDKAYAYIEENRQQAVNSPNPEEAWAAFGRLSHAAQDFYAHSNYVALWIESLPAPNGGEAGDSRLQPSAINALDANILAHPHLISGKVYWPIEALWAIRALQPLVKKWTPKDSHAWMNLDTPETSPLFPFAIEAAVKRTVVEFERTLALIGETRGEAAMQAFVGISEQ